MDIDTGAARRYFGLVRRFCAQAKAWTPGVVFIDTTPHDRLDLSKISERIYGSRHEVLTVQAAAGLDQVCQPLAQQRIALPTKEKMLQLKREAGFESIPAFRRDGAPTWKEY